MRTRTTFMTALLGATLACVAPAAAEEEFVVIKAGTVITVSGEEIPDGEIVIVDGKIRLVGTTLEYPPGTTVIEARDQTVMPGWINPYSRHGLAGYSRGGVNGHRTVEAEVDLETIDFEPFWRAGYTAVAYRPDGTGIPGVASVYRTAFPEDVDPYGDDAQLVLQPSYLRIVMRNGRNDSRTLAGALTKAKAELDKIKKAREEFDKKQAEAEKKAKAEAEAKAKAEAGKPKPAGDAKAADDEKKKAEPKKEEKKPEFKPPATDKGHQPLMDWIEGKLAVRPLIELSNAAGVLYLDETMEKWEEQKPNVMVSAGFGADFNYVVKELAERDAIVLLPFDMYRLPQTSVMYNLVASLDAAGADIALMPERVAGGGRQFRRGRRGGGGPPAPAPAADATASMRTARLRVAELVRAGLAREAAIKAVTLHPAKLLGIDGRLGSIEEGKDADLIFLDGDALDPHTKVTRVMILGDVVWEDDK